MKPISPIRRIRLKGGIPIKYFMVLLLALSLPGCSLEKADEGFANEGPSPFTDEEMYAYAEEHQIDMKVLLNTSDNDYAAILGEDELHQLYTNESDEIVSEVLEIGDGDVEFGALNSIIYAVIRDEELLEQGDQLRIEHDNGEFSTSFFLIDEEDSYYIFFETDSRVDGSVNDAKLILYDSQENLIYEQDLEN